MDRSSKGAILSDGPSGYIFWLTPWGSPYIASPHFGGDGKANKEIYLRCKRFLLSAESFGTRCSISEFPMRLEIPGLTRYASTTSPFTNAADGLDLQLRKIGRCLAKCNGLIRGSDRRELRKSMNQTAINDEFYLTGEMQEGQPIYESILSRLRSTIQNLYPANVGNDLKRLTVGVSEDCNDELLHERNLKTVLVTW